MAGALPSAFGLEGKDIGGGSVSLRWSYADDIVAQNVTFDVFASSDPLDPFRLRPAADVAALSVTVEGFEQGGEIFFSVVARREAQLSLPSAILRVPVQPIRTPEPTTAPTTAAVGSVSGMGFPFRIDALGAVSGDDGDSL